ncbi:MAG: hypothetical protein ISR65_14075 [Bacteriovoracaceae bacterium]|nr:hypothetical protein [Bacteriovoracaceae bacterium]
MSIEKTLKAPLRTVSELPEIMQLFHDMHNNEVILTAWQNVGDKRNIVTVNIKQVNVAPKTVFLSTKCIQDISNFANKSTLYLTATYKNILIKTKMVKTLGNFLVATIPEQLKVCENRGAHRLFFKPEKLPSIKFALVNKDSSKESKTWDEFIFDISSCGVGICVKSNDQKVFQVGSMIKIIEIDEQKVAEDLKLKIIYSKKMVSTQNHRKQVVYRIGGKFSQNIHMVDYFHQVHDLVEEAMASH